jgi:hypothetical protein
MIPMKKRKIITMVLLVIMVVPLVALSGCPGQDDGVGGIGEAIREARDRLEGAFEADWNHVRFTKPEQEGEKFGPSGQVDVEVKIEEVTKGYELNLYHCFFAHVSSEEYEDMLKESKDKLLWEMSEEDRTELDDGYIYGQINELEDFEKFIDTANVGEVFDYLIGKDIGWQEFEEDESNLDFEGTMTTPSVNGDYFLIALCANFPDAATRIAGIAMADIKFEIEGGEEPPPRTTPPRTTPLPEPKWCYQIGGGCAGTGNCDPGYVSVVEIEGRDMGWMSMYECTFNDQCKEQVVCNPNLVAMSVLKTADALLKSPSAPEGTEWQRKYIMREELTATTLQRVFGTYNKDDDDPDDIFETLQGILTIMETEPGEEPSQDKVLVYKDENHMGCGLNTVIFKKMKRGSTVFVDVVLDTSVEYDENKWYSTEGTQKICLVPST